ncbi:protein WHAT'S THIS FACTOR 9, mitochondrial isoform X1 [Diospyros lotus]|uniref:protein WHAT'S THIS FACTOR 9, mitochondrial isoform X1 n=1 Tax=Diospyros lotus TaxID=55363 RepID=UPI00225A31AB|nr:protein WHAT'S THIS FACTOR 9, mitochondrial isoform X1 [Diospyros lotus]XP_052194688.1 protein WHAT'S THIS FACTOR 9, mitochondrial isoform X1 [Diospyros lotus]XP_052194689.1 protein WHAT'S THIS FACTOR 9, mitochondrial isoform X1 [Diospyros lotus]XP_052194690.1 protein WHAT'S THIS FACTOR 9, mitochondrial isoform X1 [Diospyros lotus]XP_052194691.1 protein WHAT'S THIS FACTOR 9, mitochondrial isoform X1 [Diospyros lotus]XP_052194692.1 protein WHAT'S THIS FACTOR 9, mitochondrial isoform X1 [Dios
MAMAAFTRPATELRRLLHRPNAVRTFVDARVKWVRDPYLDTAVEKEKDLKPMLNLKNLILAQPSKTLPISTAALLKDRLKLPTTAGKLIERYPSVFNPFRPDHPLALPHVKLTAQALVVHNEEARVFNSRNHRKDLAERLAKLLMLAGSRKLPLNVVNGFVFDIGLPHNYILTFLSDFPEYFQLCSMDCKDANGCELLGLELVSHRHDLAVSVLERKEMHLNSRFRSGVPIPFPMELPRGFDLEKKVRNWVDEWQKLPYISPYEDAFHLSPNSDQAEKWTVAVLHELLHLLVSKKTERENVYRLGDYLGFGLRFTKALVHHPGIFYVSNKIRTQTVVLREVYRKDWLIEKHPLMGMRHRYIHLMNKKVRQNRRIQVQNVRPRKQVT